MKNKSSKCAFTIVAKNYIGLAKVLESSIKEHDSDIDFYIFVADEIPAYLMPNLSENVIESKQVLSYSSEEWINMAFKYNLTEFCTAIKPSCFQYIFENKGYNKAVYFDPDIYVYSTLKPVYDIIEDVSILVTPHLLFPQLTDNSDIPFLQSGPYNLGFLGLKNTEVSRSLLIWWRRKLIDNCFDDVLDFTFTDQKWMLMIHSYFPQNEIYVCRDIGWNVAPWNFKERRFVKKDSGFEVEYRNDSSISDKLVFIHYSGYDYKALLSGEEIRPRVMEEDVNFEDVKMMMNIYSNALKKDEAIMRKFLDLSYTYATYDNGHVIERFHRRLYRKVYEIDASRFVNPFMSGVGSFFSVIEEKGLMRKSSASDTISDNRSNKVLRFFNRMMFVVYKLFGYHRYLMLMRLLKHFSRYESQVFLLDDKYIDNNVAIPKKKTI